jgi:phosphoserine phosphatase
MEATMQLLSNDSAFSPDQTRVILLRHGRSTFNQLKLYQGSSDISVLTEQGYDMARQVGNFLKGEAIDAIYMSPLKRVQQTVDAMLEQLSPDLTKRLETHPNLREIELPGWEGRSFQDVQQAEPEAYRCWKQRPHEFSLAAPPASRSSGGSSGAVAVAVQHCYPVLDLYERAQQFWQDILPRHRGQTIIIVSHGGTNRALISTALGLPPDCFHRLQQSNCGISILNFPGNYLKAGYSAGYSAAHLKVLNLTTPLGETLPKLKEGKQGLLLLLLPIESPLNSMSSLAELLRNVPIEFSLASSCHAAQALIDQLLQYHPQTVQIQSQQARFLFDWQRTIAAKSTYSSQLITGLVIAQSSDMQQILGDAIGLSPSQYWRLRVQPGSLSILHYPNSYASVVQAFNFAA